MDRRNPLPDRDREEQLEKSSSDVSPKKITLEQHMRILGLNPHKSLDQQVGPHDTTSSGLDKPSARQTEDCSSECKEVSVLSSARDTGKCKLSPEEDRLLTEWLKSQPIGENGQRVPRVELSDTFTPDHLILVGGMNDRGETSQAGDKNKELCNEAAQYCVRREYNKAAEKLQQVLNNCKKDKNFGPRHPRTVVAMTDLADVYTMARNFEDAQKWYEEARKIYERRRDSRIKEVQAKLYLGEQVGRYRLVKFLGLGGFANVYLGEQTDSKGMVKERAAVKLFQDTDPETAETFSKEAGTLLTLRHPHIVRGLEFSNTEDDVPFLVMEYVPDGTLRDAHPEGTPVPPGQVVDYVMQIASALQYMHGRKLMHLDVKPANVLVVKEPNGKKKLLLSDFGLVRVAHSTASQSSIDRGGGTIPYMDPELLQGGRASKKSDQRALAVMVCEWFSGKRDQELGEMIYKWLGSGRCPRELRSVPDKVREVLFRAVAGNPKDRFPSVGTFASAFVAACAEHGVPIEEHVLPMMKEIREHVEAEANNAKVQVTELENEMRKLQQENKYIKEKMEGNERIKENLRERVGELQRQGQVDQQGGSWQLEQEKRTLQEKIDELNHKIRTIEEEKERLKIEIEENRKFYEDNMGYMYNSMVDHYRGVIQHNQELTGSNQALQREKQNLIDQRDRDLQRKQNQEKRLQEMVQLLEQQSLQQGDHGASTSRTSSLAKGEASSSSTGREGTKSHVEQQRREEQNVTDQVQETDQRDKGKNKAVEEKSPTSGTSSLEKGEASSSSTGGEEIKSDAEQQDKEQQNVADQAQKMGQDDKGKGMEIVKKASTSGTPSLESEEASSLSDEWRDINSHNEQKLIKMRKSRNKYSELSKSTELMYESPEEFDRLVGLVNYRYWPLFGAVGNSLANGAYKKNMKKIEDKMKEVSFENVGEIRRMIKNVSRYEWLTNSSKALGAGFLNEGACEWHFLIGLLGGGGISKV
jgi:hypothetical protein